MGQCLQGTRSCLQTDRKSTRENRCHLECALVVRLLRKSEGAHAAIPCFLSREQQESKLGQQTVTSCTSVHVVQNKKLDKLSSLTCHYVVVRSLARGVLALKINLAIRGS